MEEGEENICFPPHLPKDLRYLLLEWSLYAFLQEPDNSVFSCFCVVQMYDRFLAEHFPAVSTTVHWLFNKRSHCRWIMFKNIDYFKATQVIVQYCFGYPYDLEYYSFIEAFLKHLKENRVGFPTKNWSFSGSYYDQVFNFNLMRYQLVWFENETPKAIKNIVPLGALLAYLEK
jgi:hypothetical protein